MVETVEDVIVRKLTAERVEDLKKVIKETQEKYRYLSERLQNGWESAQFTGQDVDVDILELPGFRTEDTYSISKNGFWYDADCNVGGSFSGGGDASMCRVRTSYCPLSSATHPDDCGDAGMEDNIWITFEKMRSTGVWTKKCEGGQKYCKLVHLD